MWYETQVIFKKGVADNVLTKVVVLIPPSGTVMICSILNIHENISD